MTIRGHCPIDGGRTDRRRSGEYFIRQDTFLCGYTTMRNMEAHLECLIFGDWFLIITRQINIFSSIGTYSTTPTTTVIEFRSCVLYRQVAAHHPMLHISSLWIKAREE